MWLTEQRELLRHRADIEFIESKLGKEIAAAKFGVERDRLEGQLSWEVEIPMHEIDRIRTRRLLRKADRLSVPIPTMSDDGHLWRRSHQLGTYALTTEGYAEVRRSIRAEKRERREGALAWAGLFIGVLGALTGLLSVWPSG